MSGAAHGAGGVVLSLFPGIGLLDMAFEEAGFCVVRGPDLLWGGDIRRFHPPAGRFDGVIGGPPCQFASEMSRFNEAAGKTLAENLIPEFERVVSASAPEWFAMENVVQAPLPVVPGYTIEPTIVRDNWCGGETMRQRRISIGMRSGQRVQIETLALHRPDPELAITSGAREDRFGRVKAEVAGKVRVCSTRGNRLPIAEMARRQGLPPSFFGDRSPFTSMAQRKMLGNGVPFAMGQAVAAAVIRATSQQARGSMTPDLPSLAHRISEATGPDRELDLALARALVPDVVVSRFNPETRDNEPYVHWTYTASIDAAVALFERLLPGWWWSVGRCQREVHCTAGPDRGHPLEGVVDAVQAFGATPALAVLAALFAGLDALSPSDREPSDA